MSSRPEHQSGIRDLLDGIDERVARPGPVSAGDALDFRSHTARLVAALRAVLDLHEQVGDTCRKCNDSLYEVLYPCWTVRAITDALNG